MAGHDKTDESILEEAMDWFLRLREPHRTAADERDFGRWFERSPANRDAWTKACKTWELMGETTPIHQDLWRPAGQAKMLAARHRRRVLGAGAALALAACLVLALAGPSLFIRYRADFRTATAELRKITLEDGSAVELGAESAIDTDFANGARHVTLLSGEAFFDVKHDPARPFTVTAAGVNVTVLGTAFDVHIKPEDTTVELVRGLVGLTVDGAAKTFERSPGDSVTVSRTDGQVSRARLAPEDMAAWRNGRLFVNDVTVASVVDELQRYHSAWISIPSGDLANRRVTGLYDLSDPDRALEALVQPYGGRVHHISPYLRVLALF
ncbi:FecR family protein [Neorhizobium galegae]|uniref:FecR family protein n=1 Tax=Neorhizobium galegae TaxID=399 RepID=UPI0021082D57|nr:FecR family protein [Neorhizobium galegae]MCQ1770813.1 FecR family protein [Neorhizobium galegae]